MAFLRRTPRDAGSTDQSSNSQRTGPAPRLTIRGRPFELWGVNWANTEVVGESHYADGIRSLFPRGVSSSPPLDCQAFLIPEPKNRHDANAVAVVVSSKVVGYLSRADAARYSPALQEMVRQGLIPMTACRVFAHDYGDSDEPSRFFASVSIALDAPHLIVPVNSRPSRHRMLPRGTALQLKDEDKHMDVLAPLVAREGEAWVYATLHRTGDESGKTTKELAEVRVNGQPIGTLTPAMSAHFLPTIAACLNDGVLTAARVLLKGNSLKVEAVLYAAKAHELEAAWLKSEPEGAAAPPSGSSSPAASATPTANPPARALAPSSPPHPTDLAARTVPQKPTQIVFNSPPNWPAPPVGYEPPPGWSAPADWPDAPSGWQFWVTR